MKDKHYDAWQDAKTPEERKAAEHIRYLGEKILAAFEFLAALGYGGPAISHHNMDNVKEDAGYYEDCPRTDVVYRHPRSRALTAELHSGPVELKVTVANTDRDDYFTYDGYRRYAKRRDAGIEYFETQANHAEELCDYVFRAVKEDFSGPLKAVIQGGEWLEISLKDFQIWVKGVDESKNSEWSDWSERIKEAELKRESEQYLRLKERLLRYGYAAIKENEDSVEFEKEEEGARALLTDRALCFEASGEGIFEIGMTASEFTDTGEFVKFDPQNGGWE
jgi:hypothetical protein